MRTNWQSERDNKVVSALMVPINFRPVCMIFSISARSDIKTSNDVWFNHPIVGYCVNKLNYCSYFAVFLFDNFYPVSSMKQYFTNTSLLGLVLPRDPPYSKPYTHWTHSKWTQKKMFYSEQKINDIGKSSWRIYFTYTLKHCSIKIGLATMQFTKTLSWRNCV